MTKLDKGLKDEALAKLSAGWTAARVVKWLGESRGITITPQALTKLARERRADGAEATKRAKSDRKLPEPLEDLMERAKFLVGLIRRLERQTDADPGAVPNYLKAMEQFRRITDVCIRYTPVGSADVMLNGLADLLHEAAAQDARTLKARHG